MLIAPTEPAALKALGRSSTIPEIHGVDILWAERGRGLIGVQRKEFPGDFLASVNDGRLAKELAQMQSLDTSVLILEGRGTWTTDGTLVHPWGQPWTRSAHRRYLCTVRSMGVWVEWSDSLDDTALVLEDLRAWHAKPKHHSAQQRPGPKRNGWGQVDERAYAIHLIQGVDGVGPELAERIYDTVGMPFGLRVTEDDLRGVHGMGKVKARKFVRAFASGTEG